MRRRQVAPSRSGIIKYLAPRQFRRRNGRRGARARPPPFPPIPRARPPVAVRFPPGRVVDPAAPRIHRTDANDASLLAAALGDIARARGMTEIPKSAGIARDALYMALRPESAPRFDTVRRVCRARSVDLDERQGTLGRDELEYQLLAQGQADSPEHVPAGVRWSEPRFTLAIIGCFTPMRAASWAWVSPSASRIRRTAIASSASTIRAS
jgi:probable addiction module antidote protein